MAADGTSPVTGATAAHPRIVASVATYNERENLGPLITAIHTADASVDVLVIDDNSPDGTGALADEIAKGDARVHVLHRPGKLGLGTATVAAFTWAMQRDYEFLLNLDGDFSHDPQYIPALIGAMDEVDVAIGSRYVPGGGVEGWGWKRKCMSRGINAYARRLLRLSVRDTSGAFRCYRLAAFRSFDFSCIRSRGYSFQEEMLWHCRRLGCRFAEVPIIFRDRRFGQSKINRKEAVNALAIILRLGLAERLGGRDAKQ